jgi:hypothetical protein
MRLLCWISNPIWSASKSSKSSKSSKLIELKWSMFDHWTVKVIDIKIIKIKLNTKLIKLKKKNKTFFVIILNKGRAQIPGSLGGFRIYNIFVFSKKKKISDISTLFLIIQISIILTCSIHALFFWKVLKRYQSVYNTLHCQLIRWRFFRK